MIAVEHTNASTPTMPSEAGMGQPSQVSLIWRENWKMDTSVENLLIKMGFI